ncbi:hypothetical protein SteCoe_35962 [Stentor coeruleus]|uniref:Uncharacterized protein n=1 Tax=Stentor coeruleus TaxID=5963 RepID=A0A1R2AR47_9CILI|nr:hypothetical protein SteCoe_35962 [Stentor coeruleus]
METETRSVDQLRAVESEESTSFLHMADLPNDLDKINDFKKALEDFIIDDESDMIGDLSQIVPDSRPYNKDQYDSILLNARSSRAICQRFDLEPCGLIKSDAQGQDFTLPAILNRMKIGHKVYKYNYNTPSRKIVTIKITQGIIEIYTSDTRKNRVGFTDVYGITLGSASSTFKMYKGQIDFKYGKLHTHEDCFSIINEFRSYDFGTTSHLARYDICLSMSWLCSLNNSLQSNVPFTKYFLSFKNVSEKLRRESSIRLISMNELLLLAIYKTLKQMENAVGMNKIVTILNKRFTFSGKLYRFIRFIVMPIISGDSYTRKELKDKIRVNLLIGNKLNVLATIMNRVENEDDKLKAKTKKTVFESMIIPSVKSIFKKSKTNDPFLAMLRQKAIGSSK